MLEKGRQIFILVFYEEPRRSPQPWSRWGPCLGPALTLLMCLQTPIRRRERARGRERGTSGAAPVVSSLATPTGAFLNTAFLHLKNGAESVRGGTETTPQKQQIQRKYRQKSALIMD